METVFSELLLNRERCFVCGNNRTEFFDVAETSVRGSQAYPLCRRCSGQWQYAMGWYAGRHGRASSSMVPVDACVYVEMLWRLYHELVNDTGVEEHERTRAVKRTIHCLADTDTLERSDVFYSDLFDVVSQYHGNIDNGLRYYLDKFGYFGVYHKLLDRIDADAVTLVDANAST